MNKPHKPMPPPPFAAARTEHSKDPFGGVPPIPQASPDMDEDPRLKDEAVLLAFKQFLRPDQQKEFIYKFILAYVHYRSIPQASEMAGIKSTQGNYYRQKPEIHACIEAITQMAVIKHGYDANNVIERAKEIANFDPIVLENPDGSFKNRMSEIPADARRAIKKMKVKNLFGEDPNGMRVVIGQIIDLEFYDKLRGIELLGSEKNLFKKTTVVQHDVTSNMKDVLLESGNRAEERLRLMAARTVTEEVSGGQMGESEGSDRSEGWSDDGVPVGEQGGSGAGD